MSLAVAPLDLNVEVGANRPPNTVRDVRSDLPCRTFDPDLWFAETPTELELAKSLCLECPLRVECLAGALERGAVVPRKRPRGRPRKEDVARDAVLRVEVAARAAALVAGVAA